MEVVNKVLVKFGFTRSSFDSPGVKVVLGVPGCGKSSCIREILRSDSRFEAYTFGACDNKTVTNCYIKAVPKDFNFDVNGRLIIIDEFQAGPWEDFKPTVIFGDICQFDGSEDFVPRAHWYSLISHRIGANISRFLRDLGFEIESAKPDTLSFGGLYDTEPEGQVITYCSRVGALLQAHSVNFLNIEECRGRTFEIVTLCLEDNIISAGDRGKFYLCATRASSKLIVLTPDATKPTT
nr:TGB1 [Garlic yellow virus]QED44830.1 TGB1 [Garlic yellow virus]